MASFVGKKLSLVVAPSVKRSASLFRCCSRRQVATSSIPHGQGEKAVPVGDPHANASTEEEFGHTWVASAVAYALLGAIGGVCYYYRLKLQVEDSRETEARIKRYEAVLEKQSKIEAARNQDRAQRMKVVEATEDASETLNSKN